MDNPMANICDYVLLIISTGNGVPLQLGPAVMAGIIVGLLAGFIALYDYAPPFCWKHWQ